MTTLLNKEEIETLFQRLENNITVNVERDKGPKKQPDPFRSAISCMLSAQSLDSNTAKASNALFKLAQTPHDILALSDAEIIEAIKPAGLYNRKVIAIKKFCTQLIADFDGKVPDDRAGLMTLYGIGRKCADIVLQFAFGHDTIAVDTHVARVCKRTGLAMGRDEAQIAQSLENRAPDWAFKHGHFWLIKFGKTICTSRSPKCDTCFLNDICLEYKLKANQTGKNSY